MQDLHILLIEDRSEDVEFIVRELKKSGLIFTYTVVESEGAFRQAIETSYDIILSDFNLPSFDVIRALVVLTELKKKVPLVVVTGSVGEEAAVAVMRLGASDYLLKEHLSDLPHIVRSVILRQKKEDNNG